MSTSTEPTPSGSSPSTGKVRCLLCGRPASLLYESTVPAGESLTNDEVACTSNFLAQYDDIYYCRACRLARSALSVDEGALADAYRDVEDPEYLVSEEERRRSFREALEIIERYSERGRMFEIGSSVGLFLDEARSRGWEVVGVEPSCWAADEARRRGLEVHPFTLEEFDPEGQLFDAVALWDVLEHLVDPVDSLRRTRALLKPGGVLALTTINIGGLGAKFLGRRWPWLMRMHLHYFTRKSLAELVSRQGFDVLEVTTQTKVLKVGYLLDRSSGHFGFLAGAARWVVDRLHLADFPVKVDLGDILFLVARKRETSEP